MFNVFSFECDVSENCNYSCVGCSHWAPAHGVKYTTPEEMARDLAHLSRVAHAQKFCVLGGEPLLHPDLAGVLRAIRVSGISDIIELWTNGSLLHKASDAVWANLDSVTVNSYPGKLTAEHEANLIAIARAHNVPIEIDHPTQFYYSAHTTPREETKKYFAACPYQDHCWAVHHGYLYRCPQSISLAKFMLHISSEEEGLKLANVSEDAVRDFLTNMTPKKSCAVCARRDAWFDWREAKRKDWQAESMLPMASEAV